MNSTFSANIAGTDGGGIYQLEGTLSLNHVTATLNTAGRAGGGLAVASGTSQLGNSIIAGNTATTSDLDLSGSFSSLGSNLIGDVGGSSGIVNGLNGDLAGNSGSVIDPRLGPLASNGGPTQTHALLVTQAGETLIFSPAIDAGNSGNSPATDQRGFPRNDDGDNQNGSAVDIGAFELPLNRRPVLDTQNFNVTENVAIGTTVCQRPRWQPVGDYHDRWRCGSIRSRSGDW